jgi:Gpi18-like mannosyltransferase
VSFEVGAATSRKPGSAAVLLLPLSGVAVALALLPIASSDLTDYVIPWMQALQQRGAAGLSGEFSDYTPPYLYLLYLVRGLLPQFGSVALIKLLNLPFVAAMAVAVGCTVAAVTGDRSRGLLAGAVLCVAPTVLVNAFAWGQSDVIYTCFLLFFVLFACTGRPFAAAAVFGLGLSFKLQSMFLSPFLLYLLLSGQLRLRHLAVIPPIYVLMMIPAAMAGRPWGQLLTIYYQQSRSYGELSLFAPNPWWFAEHWHLLPSRGGAYAGIVMGAVAGLAIALTALKLKESPRNSLFVATLSAAAMPYVLPRMHDRYFFVVDVLSLALAFVYPRYWLATLLFQIGSLTSYLAYFGLSMSAPGFAVVPVTAGLLLLLMMFRDSFGQAPAVCPDENGAAGED